jgi:hypothetical protein
MSHLPHLIYAPVRQKRRYKSTMSHRLTCLTGKTDQNEFFLSPDHPTCGKARVVPIAGETGETVRQVKKSQQTPAFSYLTFVSPRVMPVRQATLSSVAP